MIAFVISCLPQIREFGCHTPSSWTLESEIDVASDVSWERESETCLCQVLTDILYLYLNPLSRCQRLANWQRAIFHYVWDIQRSIVDVVDQHHTSESKTRTEMTRIPLHADLKMTENIFGDMIKFRDVIMFSCQKPFVSMRTSITWHYIRTPVYIQRDHECIPLTVRSAWICCWVSITLIVACIVVPSPLITNQRKLPGSLHCINEEISFYRCFSIYLSKFYWRC